VPRRYRVRGHIIRYDYFYLESFVLLRGFEIQKLGHTITAVFDPNAYTETGFISCFAEPEEAAEFLTYKRGR